MPERAIKTILMPTDFSDSAASALGWAQALATAFEAKIVLLHAVDTVSYVWIPAGPASVPAPVPEEVEKRIMDVAQESLHRLAAKAPEVSRRIIRKGHPREVILEVATDIDADIIVMGTHGRRGVSHLFIGSVAEHVVRHSPVPVLTIRGTGASAPRPR